MKSITIWLLSCVGGGLFALWSYLIDILFKSDTDIYEAIWVLGAMIIFFMLFHEREYHDD